MWVEFVRYPEGTMPIPISNDRLYYDVNNNKEMTLGVDLVLISERLWNCFLDWYGGGPTLKWRIDNKDPPDQISKRPNEILPASS